MSHAYKHWGTHIVDHYLKLEGIDVPGTYYTVTSKQKKNFIRIST